MYLIESFLWVGTTLLIENSHFHIIPGIIKFLLSLLLLRVYLELRKV